jgi:hypothetical protein
VRYRVGEIKRNTILAGRFNGQARAEQAITALEATGFQREQMATFFVNPAGQHGENVPS